MLLSSFQIHLTEKLHMIHVFDTEAFSTHANATAVLGGRVKFAD